MASQTVLLEYLTTTRIGEKGQLTVPKQFREDLGLENGAPFAVLRMGDGLILLPEQRRFDELCLQISTSLSSGGITTKEMQATLPKARQHVYEKHYGKSASAEARAQKTRTRRKK